MYVTVTSHAITFDFYVFCAAAMHAALRQITLTTCCNDHVVELLCLLVVGADQVAGTGNTGHAEQQEAQVR